MIGTRSIPLAGAVMSRFYPSLFNLSGGERIYALKASSNAVHQYLPPVVPNTRLLFIAINVTNACYVRSSSRASLIGNSALTVQLTRVGDYIELIADAAGNTWIPANYTVIIR